MLQDKIREDIIGHIIALAKTRAHAEDNTESLISFIQQFYFNADLEDLQNRSVENLCDTVLAMWGHFLIRQKEPKVQVLNPNLSGAGGWYSSNTVIMITHEDIPFLLDSILMVLNEKAYRIVFLEQLGNLSVKRDKTGKLINFDNHSNTTGQTEVSIFIEIKRLPDEKICFALENELKSVVQDVVFAVEDWQPMKKTVSAALNYLKENTIPHTKEDIFESIEFFKWISENHFTFLGYYETILDNKKVTLVEKSRLGVARKKEGLPTHYIDLDVEFSEAPDLTMTEKSNTLSTVHRSVYADVLSLKKYDSTGKLIGECKWVGLYTSSAYNWRPTYTPMLRVKIHNILRRANVLLLGHDGKNLLNVIESLPRDDIFLGTEDDLYDLVLGILRLRERPKVKLFVRHDLFKRYYSCFIFIPKERFDSNIRRKFQSILEKEFESSGVTFSTQLSDSTLARIHFLVRVKTKQALQVDVPAIEKQLFLVSRIWSEELEEALVHQQGESKSSDLYAVYANAFPSSYKEEFGAEMAVHDILQLEQLRDKPLSMSFYRPIVENSEAVHFKTYVANQPLILSHLIPLFEHLGFQVISEKPHKIQTTDKIYWINDFCLLPEATQITKLESVKEAFQDAFYRIWAGQAENDNFNRLVLACGLNWREIAMLRAYSRYLRQIGSTYSQHYVEQTLSEQATIAKLLVELFLHRFDITTSLEVRTQKTTAIQQTIEAQLEKVLSLDQDRILRRFLNVISSTLRTNFFQKSPEGEHKPYLAFKIHSKQITDIPLPCPLFEIFIYSPRMEGIHLRNAKVARGGIRWSDRLEDYRTEILGLVKAQQVKNAVIVPMGAKGGFVVKKPPKNREELAKEVIVCYQTLIQGLLDLTDNFKTGQVVPPNQVVRYDEDDIYLVVAADKGTASFSDIANAISLERDFWLGDAFASGGSAGYDHKKMAITARGAWESVKRHFRELGIDTQAQDFTVVGIGDMAGDVFGNGMLLSPHIQLVGAFNHLHIFVDPNPNASKSFEERKRLFELPRSNWTDYNPELISKGGGVFLRSAKSIPISPEMQARFGITQTKLEPNIFIRALLMAEVDLLWNGGIGTYVKATTETHADVGDKNNDFLRINGQDLCCKVVGEGGNLGFTQLGRVEYALNGGHLNTDAIDNSAGVNCSDYEVNIKILLNALMASGQLTERQRNELLIKMTAEVAELVLHHNRSQTEALSIAHYQNEHYVDMHSRLIEYLSIHAGLDRTIEFLPSEDTLIQRKKQNQGLTRPELAVLMAYTKILLKSTLIASDIPDNPYISQQLTLAFPTILSQQYAQEMKEHRLHREIIVMRVANNIVDEMGLTFLHRLQDETGSEIPDIVRAYSIVREVFEVVQLKDIVRQLSVDIEDTIKIRILQELNRLTRRGTRWFLRNRAYITDIETSIQRFTLGVRQVVTMLPTVLKGKANKDASAFSKELIQAKISKELAYRVGFMSAMFSALDIVDAALDMNMKIEPVASLYYTIGSKLDLSWLREQIKQHPVNTHWDALARAAFRDDLDSKQRDLAVGILKSAQVVQETGNLVDSWLKKHEWFMTRWKHMMDELKSSQGSDFTRFAVTLRELRELVNLGLG